jgi:mono/diheme cytochrome c family protein
MQDVAKSMFLLMLLAALLQQQGVRPGASPAPAGAVSGRGKDIFISRCAKCHDQDANKKLPDGTTLLQRLAKSKDPEARLGTRIQNAQDRHEVMLYVQELMTRARSSQEPIKRP